MPDRSRSAPRAKVACLLSGNGTTMSALLFQAKLPDCPYEIVAVGSNHADAPGLGIAAAEGIATFAHSHKGLTRAAHEALIDAALRASGADYVALCGYMRILTPEFVAGWAGRMLNTHPSLLPAYKGLDTHQRAIDASDSHGGCSVHVVTPELDGGPVLGQVPVAILPGDTPDSLARRVLLAEYQLYPRMLADYVARAFRADWLLEEIRTRALALPDAEEAMSHGANAFKIAGKSGKYFAYFSVRHHGEPHIALLVKTSGADEMAGLIEADPETYYRPAYYGAAGWIGVVLNRPGVDWDSVEHWLARSWRAIAPARLTRLMDRADEF